MWVLDVIHASTNVVETSYYLHAGEWSLGRKKCHFNFHDDSSISRSHAVIRVGALSTEQLRDPLSRPALILVDQNSRFGSFVNQEQCFTEQELKHGDQITFGAKRTVLRVRYQVFVLVASRISSRNRARVNDTCQRIGMHLIPAQSKFATHCIMDPGRIVATIKVLWALVYNQPVVTTQWIYAIAERKSLSEPLPRCDQFLPTDESLPSVASNYLPNPMRKTLFHNHVVVFLASQSMEELIAAVDGIVIAAYEDQDHDDQLLRKIEQSAQSRNVLIVEPLQGSGFSSGAGSSDARDPGGSSYIMTVERRVDLLRSMGAAFTTIQELAASVIFVKPPVSSSECSFSSSLAGHNSMSAQIMSFPEHLSLRPPKDENHSGDEEGNKHEDERSITWDCAESARQYREHHHAPQSRSLDRQGCVNGQTEECATESNLVKDEPIQSTSPNPITHHEETKPLKSSDNRSRSDKVADYGVQHKLTVVSSHEAVSKGRRYDEKVPRGSEAEWVSSRSLPPRQHLRNDNLDINIMNGEDAARPIVIRCKLVIKKTGARSQDAISSDQPGVANFKRFKKGNGYASRSMASLFPKQTVVNVVLDSSDREIYNQDLEALEEQERIAEELFAMVEKRKTKKRL